MEALEPILEDHEIQGNILAGFNKPFQNFISLAFGDDIVAAKLWLSQLNITSLKDVMDFRKRFRAFKRFDLLERNIAPKALWMNIGFSYQGLLKLTPTATAFTDDIFKRGLGFASARLKDPTEASHPGNQKNWLFGGIGNEPDVLIIIGADEEAEIQSYTEEFIANAEVHGLKCLHIDHGNDLGIFGNSPEEIETLRATEHFGFKDGVSHPAVRGRLNSNGTFLNIRQLPAPVNPIDIAFAKPGQPLIFPGEFILGSLRQSDSSGQVSSAAYPIGNELDSRAPQWAKNGSFLVHRRLRQDIKLFDDFLEQQSTKLAGQQCPISPDQLSAMIVGRWPNGAPLLSNPDKEPEHYNNDQEDIAFEKDLSAKLCPASAHIRKVNPRMLTSEQGSPQKTLVHRMLRRGIPFGKLYKDDPSDDRGLLFVSYQSNIGEQFEFLQKNWANHDKNPHSLTAKAGHDLIIGQTMKNRNRYLNFNFNNKIYSIDTNEMKTKDWVVPTGGGYYFSPSISAISDVLSK